MRTLLAVFLAASVLPAFAADANNAAVKVMGACRADLRKHCRPAGAGGPLKCLKDHKSEVSEACREALGALGEAAPPAAPSKGEKPKSCLPEFTKACAGEKSKDFKACLKKHRKEFSAYCQKAADAAE